MLQRLSFLVALAVLAGGPASAQTAPPSPRPAPCTGPEFRQFDFWAGAWDVRDTKSGALVGSNEITPEFRGCVLHEHWKGINAPPGGGGESFNLYDPARKRWHQTWVDASGGGVLLLDGGLEHGVMRLRGTSPDPKGTRIDEITYTPGNDGTVRQLWRSSTDRGTTWQTQFDGIYTRKPPAMTAAPPSAKIAPFAWLAGGVWTTDGPLQGGLDRIETRYALAPNGRLLTFTTRFVMKDGSWPNGYAGNLYYDDATATTRMWYIASNNEQTSGPIALDGERWSMRFTSDGAVAGHPGPTDFRVDVTRISPDAYSWQLNAFLERAWKPVFGLTYRRRAG